MLLQAGDFAAAQPLYERALGIWEATQGPDHPDVAHTLTDLAVLHLEQVRALSTSLHPKLARTSSIEVLMMSDAFV